MMDLYSRLEELRLDGIRRRPMTPDQMLHFYGRVAERPENRMYRLGAILSAITMTLRRWIHAPVAVHTARPAYRGA